VDPRHFRLLNDWQQDFPRCDRPFAVVAAEVGLDEDAVLAVYREWRDSGLVSRLGPVFATRRVGASALVALAATPAELEAVAARVNAVPEVNHNYEREHHFNLWFVITAVDEARLDAIVAELRADTGCEVIVLPMEEAHHIDLGFDLSGSANTNTQAAPPVLPALGAPCSLAGVEQALMRALQDGLPLVSSPYAELGKRIGLNGAAVCGILDGWLASGVLRRFGVVVRHHELGYTANAMCVWDIPDALAAELGRRLGAESGVTLCYRRRRALPHWPYNLFCMIHGKARQEVLATRDGIATRLGLDAWPHAVLFSGQRFKQRGACYMPESADV